mmetsp:Transcript_64350/g.140082  ORF Transcript_64350/g.140082 Transcript_64350/m.140082 type:complete len:300 (-) Transcript_64350:669-1568(-)
MRKRRPGATTSSPSSLRVSMRKSKDSETGPPLVPGPSTVHLCAQHGGQGNPGGAWLSGKGTWQSTRLWQPPQATVRAMSQSGASREAPRSPSEDKGTSTGSGWASESTPGSGTRPSGTRRRRPQVQRLGCLAPLTGSQTAKAWLWAKATEMTADGRRQTMAGMRRSSRSPWPSWPQEPQPQVKSQPHRDTAALTLPPAAIEAIRSTSPSLDHDRPSTCVNQTVYDEDESSVEMPRQPCDASPVASTSPYLVRSREWWSPAATCAPLAAPMTMGSAAASRTRPIGPRPSCPISLLPHTAT